MARRKQQNPRHLESSQELATSLQNGIASSSDSEDDEHVCGRCRAEFPSLTDFLKHKVLCVSKRPVLVISDAYRVEESDPKETCSSNEDDDALSPPTLTSMNCTYPDDTKRLKLSDVVQQVSDTNVTLEELKNTSVAVAQHRRILHDSHLALLLSHLHNQQMVQMHAIQELQTQILGPSQSPKPLPLIGTVALTPPQSAADSVIGLATPSCTQPSAPVSTRTSTIAMNNIHSNDLPSYEPNTLELLQRHTEQALQNTMSGGSFLLSSTGNPDLARLKQSKEGKSDDPAMRHKCRFCGKAFGSDSGLQIHLRSHTGERPFKCTVCGSCFSTKGNLKVHFQRHKERMEVPNDFQNGVLNHIPTVNGDPNGNLDGQQNEKATDITTDKAGDKTSGYTVGTTNGQSRSLTPNDISTLSEDSHDISGDGDHDMRINDDDDDHDSNSSALNNNMEEELDSSIRLHQSSFASPTFTSFFRPTTFSGTLPDNPLCLPRPTSSTAAGAGDNSAFHRDPSLYQELLPRIGSNDNSWESLMEVTETSETSKLQKLVDKIEVTDPNQCVVCHRVLSCKSALQMHYRTHTGERPFKCKICCRAFTTKGNLKTHMSVHRHKPPTRMLHQCPVCHKQFANSIILQQHIRVHTSARDVMIPEAMLYADNKGSTLLPPSYPRPMILPPHLESSEPLALISSDSKKRIEAIEYQQQENSVKAIGNDLGSAQVSAVSSPAASTSSSNTPTPNGEDASAVINDMKSLIMEQTSKNTAVPKSESSECSSPINMMSIQDDSPTAKEKEKDAVAINCNERLELSPSPEIKSNISPNRSPNANDTTTEFKTSTSDNNNNNLDAKTERMVHPMMVSLANDKPLPMTLPSDCPIRLNVPSERQILPLNIPHTASEFTASLTALENHVKAINSSTTNPLPFPTPPLGLNFSMTNYYRQDYNFSASSKDKTQVFSPPNSKNGSDASTDERSTPGSMTKPDSPKFSLARSDNGALDLTPRGGSSTSNQRHTTDLKVFPPLAGLPFPPPPHTRIGTTCQICFKTFACQSALEIHYRSHTKERPFKCDVCDRGFSTKGNMKQHMLTHKIRDLPAQLFTSSQPTMVVNNSVSQPGEKFDEPAKRPPHAESGSGPPTPRKSGLPKHVCEVCHKPFSSGSALQIHMRTHTGVKPFQCNICGRAFTTKGNLKVHMGTHLANNGSSRRGRRMSLDVSPLSLSLSKHGEYSPRQDMFFPYLPPFMNGMPQPHAKMNEISVIQSAGNREDSIASMAAATFSMASPSFATASVRPLSLVANSQKQEFKRQDEDIQRRSPGRSKDPSSPGRSAADTIAAVDRTASWGWKIACNRCNKIYSSSAELEMHISQEHMKAEAPENHEPVLEKAS